jgi:hypothetical protein
MRALQEAGLRRSRVGPKLLSQEATSKPSCVLLSAEHHGKPLVPSNASVRLARAALSEEELAEWLGARSLEAAV